MDGWRECRNGGAGAGGERVHGELPEGDGRLVIPALTVPALAVEPLEID